MIERDSLLVRTLSSFVMLIIFIVIVYSDNLIFLFFSQFLLFLTSWEILRMLEFKRYEKKKVAEIKDKYKIKKNQFSNELIFRLHNSN